MITLLEELSTKAAAARDARAVISKELMKADDTAAVAALEAIRVASETAAQKAHDDAMVIRGPIFTRLQEADADVVAAEQAFHDEVSRTPPQPHRE